MFRPAAVLQGRLIALANSARSFASRALVAAPFQSVPRLSRPEKQNAPRTCGRSDLKKQKFSSSVSSIRLFPARPRYLFCLPPPSSSSLFSFVPAHHVPVAPVVQVVNLEVCLCLGPWFEPQVGRTFDFICKKKTKKDSIVESALQRG